MSFFSKLKDLISRKKTSEKIEEKNKEQVYIEQKKFDDGLKRSSSILDSKINEIAKKYQRVDEDLIEAIEDVFLSFDLGTSATKKILDAIVDEIKYQKVNDPNLIKQIIVDKLFVYYIQDTNIDTAIKLNKDKTNVILVTGANGVGKTTSIAKLAHKFTKQGLSVCLVAGDTFRAGAVEQLKIWAKKINIPIFEPQKSGQDPASVIFSGLKYATDNHVNVVICDTSGRLQNKLNLMNELKKIDSVIKKFDSTQPCESLLVIDATTGQSGIAQAKSFNEVTKLTGIVLTKMDSTSKGGIILSIKDAFNLPVKFIGLGESLDDLQEFDLELFIHGLVNNINLDKK